ncbi:bestrophin family protein [Lampropedia puyangensis]
MLFVWRGSVLPIIMPQLVATTTFAILITLLHGAILSWKVSLNFVPFSLIGITLAIFLGFRNSTAYARYWEARTLLGTILVAARSLAGQGMSLSSDPQAAKSLAYRLCAFSHAVKHQLRGTDPRDDLRHFLSAEDAQKVQESRYPAAKSLWFTNQWVGENLRQGNIQAAVVPALEQSIAQLGAALGGCERIASTPIPFTYSVIIHRCIYLYCFWLPFGLQDAIGYMTPVIVCIIAYTFFALEALGAQLEDPFGTESNDLPLSAIAYTVEASVLELVGEAPRTEQPMLKDFVLL